MKQNAHVKNLVNLMASTGRKIPLIVSVKQKGKVAHISIDGHIGRYWNGAEQFKSKVESLVADGVEDVHVYLNTEGGSVFGANEIVNIIKKFTGKITGEGGALVASAGTFIAINLAEFTMPKNGMWMHHKPMAELYGNEGEIEIGLKLLKTLTESYRNDYAAKMGITPEEFEAEWSKGDVWLSAQEAKEKGLISGITDEAEITSSVYDRIAACGCETPPKINIKSKLGIMDVTAVSLGLPADATDAQIQAKLDELKNAAAENKRLKDAQAAAQEAEHKAKIKALLDKAEADNLIVATSRKTWEKLAESDFESVKNTIEAMPKMAAGSQHLGGGSKGKGADVDMSFEDLMEDNAEGAVKMAKADPEKFKAICAKEGLDADEQEELLNFYKKA